MGGAPVWGVGTAPKFIISEIKHHSKNNGKKKKKSDGNLRSYGGTSGSRGGAKGPWPPPNEIRGGAIVSFGPPPNINKNTFFFIMRFSFKI